MLGNDLKKGSAEFLVLSLLEHERRHGYELNKLIESRSNGVLTFHIASLYPLLYRMEDRGWIVGRWVEKAGERRRRFYSITAAGRRALDALREGWLEFAAAVALVTGVQHG
ncbi:MAG: transcriptional regulator, PadR-family [Gemmatimonadetes bacterium]|nr:transcriptional regulator, PadR-family [Gemmatimonadota bacterium]